MSLQWLCLQESSLVSYHSKMCDDQSFMMACSFPIIPFESKPEYERNPGDDQDIIDEAIHMFRANILFKNYKIKGPADKVIVYLTSFIQVCMQNTMKRTKE